MLNKYKRNVNISLHKKTLDIIDGIIAQAEKELNTKLTRSGIIETALIYYFRAAQIAQAKQKDKTDKNKEE